MLCSSWRYPSFPLLREREREKEGEGEEETGGKGGREGEREGGGERERGQCCCIKLLATLYFIADYINYPCSIGYKNLYLLILKILIFFKLIHTVFEPLFEYSRFSQQFPSELEQDEPGLYFQQSSPSSLATGFSGIVTLHSLHHNNSFEKKYYVHFT